MPKSNEREESMKASRNIKKPVMLVIAVMICLAVLMSVAVLSVWASETQAETPVPSLQVAMRGNLSMRFIFKALPEGATGFKAEVDGKTYTYGIDDVKVVDEEKGTTTWVVAVPLFPTQMGETITVKAMNGETEVATYTSSVLDYAEKVMARDDENDDLMRALLNWGAYSEIAFDEDNASNVNNGLFEKNDPINAVTADSISKNTANTVVSSVSVTDSTVFLTGENGSYMTLVLSKENVKLRFYIKAGSSITADKLDATILGSEWKDQTAKDVAAVKKDGYYVLDITNITTTYFDQEYTVVVKSGNDNITIKTSVLRYLELLMDRSNVSEANKNAGKALYQFYQLSAGATDADTCTHANAAATYYYTGDANNMYHHCPVCFTKLDTISKSLNMYLNPEALEGIGSVGEFSKTPMMENGVMFTRFKITAISEWEYNAVTCAPNARYMVMKYRVGANEINQTKLEIRVKAGSGSMWTGNAEASIKVSEDNQWHTVVIDLATRASEYIANSDGSYSSSSMQIRPFTNNQSGVVGTDKYTDISYIAFVDDLSKVKGIVDEEIYEYSIDATSNSQIYTATNKCITHTPVEIVTKGENGAPTYYTYSCSICNTVLEKRTVSASVNYHSSLDGMGTCNQHLSKLNYDAENNVVFNRYAATTGKQLSDYINVTGGGGIGSATTEKYLPGKYLVFKYRTDATAPINLVFDRIGPSTEIYGDKYGEITKENMSTEWTVSVVNLQEMFDAGLFTSGTETQLYIRFKVPQKGIIDIAYVALVDSVDDIKELVTDAYYLDHGTSLLNKGVLTLAGDKSECTHSYAWIDGVYKCSVVGCGYEPVCKGNHNWVITAEGHSLASDCEHCGQKAVTESPHTLSYTEATAANGDKITTLSCSVCPLYNETTVPSSINYFAPLDEMTKLFGTLEKNLYDAENGVIYNRYDSGADTYLHITGGGTTTTTYDGGRYLVFKYRTDSKHPAGLKVDIVGKSNNTGEYASFGAQSKDNVSSEWKVAVVDISSMFPGKDTTETTLYIRFFMNGIYSSSNGSAGTNDDGTPTRGIIDIAYVAMTDTLGEVESLVLGQDSDAISYDYYGTSFANTPTTHTITQACETHATPLTVTQVGTSYIYTCPTCNKDVATTTVPADINYFAPLNDMGKCNGTLDKLQYDAVNKVVFNRHTFSKTEYINVTGGDQTGNATTATFDGGRYLVFKYRMTSVDGGTTIPHLGVNAIATSTTVDNNNKFGGQTKIQEEWAVAVIDVSKIFPAGDKTESNLFIRFNMNYPAIIDIAYVAMADSFEEISMLVTDETFDYYGTSFSNTPTVFKTTDKGCTTHAAYQENIVAHDDKTVYTYTCTLCGKVINTRTIPNTVNYYAPLAEMGHGNDTMSKLQYDAVNDVVFNRYNCSATQWVDITGGSGSGSATTDTYDGGRYLVFKYRMTSVDGTSIPSLSINAIGTSTTVDNNKFGGQKKVQEKWAVAVIDVSRIFPAGDTAESNLFIRFYAGVPGIIDIAYVAMADTLEEVSALVKTQDDTYDFYGASFENTPTAYSTKTNGCVEHTAVTETSEVVGESTVYTYTCNTCGKVVNTKTISSTVNYFAPLADMKPYQSNSLNCLYDEIEGIAFNRFENNTSADINLYISKNSSDNSSGTSTTHEPGQFLVIKYRGTAKLKLRDFGITGTNTATLGTQTADAIKGEWTVAVINLQNYLSTIYGEDLESATSVYLRFLMEPGQIDLAYVAIVDSLDEMRGVVDSSVDGIYHYYADSFGNTPNEIRYTENDTLPCGGDHTSWQYNSEYHYRAACPYCGQGAKAEVKHDFSEKDWQGLKTMVCSVCGVPEFSLDVPEYYHKDNYLDNKVQAIKDAVAAAGDDADVFFFISDMHWERNTKHSPALIKYIQEKLADSNITVDRLFKGGDDEHAGMLGYSHKAIDMAFNGNIYHSIGNHENGFGVTSEQVVNLLNTNGYDKNIVYGDKAKNYFYVENKAQKTRYIVLNPWLQQTESETKYDVTGNFDEAQLDWFQNTALAVDDDWTIFIVAHGLCDTDGSSIMTSQGYDKIENIIKNYNGKGTIAAYMQGHTHLDRVNYIETVRGDKIPVVLVASDQRESFNNDIERHRFIGTVEEQAFDVVIHDKANRKITFIRIGALARYTADGEFVETREVYY